MTNFQRMMLMVLGATVALALAACGKRAHSLEVHPPEMVFGTAGATMQIEAEARDSRGAKLATAPVIFRSRNPAVATVDSTGTVTAVGHGTSTIEVVVEGSEVMDFVSVNVRLPDRIELRPGSTTCYIGGVKTIKAKVIDQSGKTIPNVPIEWSTSDEAKARIEEGEVTGIDEGEAIITAKALGLEATSTITVSWAPGQKAMLEAEQRASRGGGGRRRGGGEKEGQAWDPRLSMFD